MEVARLFLQAGDPQHALKNYAAAIALDKNNVDALTEAGETAFSLGNYQEADRYLKAALDVNPQAEKSRQLLVMTEMVLSGDPLEPHITKQERQERLLQGFDQAHRRLEGCLVEQSDSQEIAQLGALKDRLSRSIPSYVAGRPPDNELTRSGVELIYEIEKATSAACGQPQDLDQALLLIGQKHGGAQP